MIEVCKLTDGCAVLYKNGNFFGPKFPSVIEAETFLEMNTICITDGYAAISRRAKEWLREHPQEDKTC